MRRDDRALIRLFRTLSLFRPQCRWTAYSIEPTVMHVRHILHPDWIGQKLGIVISDTPDSSVVKALYCAMVLSLGSEPKSDRRDAVFQGFLQRYEAYKEESDVKDLAGCVAKMIEEERENGA